MGLAHSSPQRYTQVWLKQHTPIIYGKTTHSLSHGTVRLNYTIIYSGCGYLVSISLFGFLRPIYKAFLQQRKKDKARYTVISVRKSNNLHRVYRTDQTS